MDLNGKKFVLFDKCYFFYFSMICFIDQSVNEDGLIVPPDKKKNPWDNSKKCSIL